MALVTREPATEQRVLLHGISWATYEALLSEIESRAIRLTYDRGELEIMTLSHRHEGTKKLLARLVETLTEVLGLPIKSGGSTTLRRALLERGLEPDESYWVENEPRLRQVTELDLARDPPPDLVIEVEVSRSALDRVSIYAALGVPELWRHTGEHLVFHVLADGRYVETATSRSFPALAAADLTRFLESTGSIDETTWIRGFRAWVQDELVRRPGK